MTDQGSGILTRRARSIHDTEPEGRRRTRSLSRSRGEFLHQRKTGRSVSRSRSPSHRRKISRKVQSGSDAPTESQSSKGSQPDPGDDVTSQPFNLDPNSVNPTGSTESHKSKVNMNNTSATINNCSVAIRTPSRTLSQNPKKTTRVIRQTKTAEHSSDINSSAKDSTLLHVNHIRSPPSSSLVDIPTPSGSTSSDVTDVSYLKTQVERKDVEIRRLKTLLGIRKEKSNQQDIIINQLTSLNKDNTKKVTKLEITNAALTAKLDSALKSNVKRPIQILDSSTGRKKTCLSKIRLKDISGRFDDTFPERLIPISIEARRFVDVVVFNLITESIQETSGHVIHQRKRDWNGRCEMLDSIPENFILGTPLLYLGDDEDALAVPFCPLEVSISGRHFTEIDSNSIIKASLRMAIHNSTKFQHFSTGEAWNDLLVTVSGDTFTQELYKRKLSSKLSNHKRKTRISFFSVLGYDKFTSTSDRDGAKKQRKDIQNSLLPGLGDCDPTDTEKAIKIVDTSHWRTADWDEIFNASAEELDPEPEITQIKSSGNDILFRTNAARKCFIEFTGYFPSEDDSILTLARADSWFTTSILLAHLPEAKGGSQTCVYVDCFAKLLPLATKRILNSIRIRAQSVCREEFLMRDEQDFDPSSATTTVPSATHFKLKFGERSHTAISFIPSKRCYYLSLTKKTFQDQICHWLYFVDCYVGQAYPHDFSFMPISDLVAVPNNHLETVPAIPLRMQVENTDDNNVTLPDLTGEEDDIEDYEIMETENASRKSPVGNSPVADLFDA